ncbi:MAG TPA: PKD domain-containing protein, partial [Methanothrix sp.]|nr:PKD domain-containing protein [Methanothrix sp.]
AHSWQRAGRYMIAARAEDSANASSLWSSPREVVVNSPPGQPAIPAGKSTILPGEITSFATSAEDPDGDRLRYIFHWGDGSFSTTDWTESGRALRIAHSWQRAGRYMIAAKAEDSANASSPWSEAITIIINTLPGRPDQPSGPGSGYAMVPYNFQTSAIDQDGDSLNYTFDWGDGTTLDLDLIGSGINVSSNHTWTVPGTYQIKAIALDRMGGEWSEERSITIAANEQPDPPRDLYGLRSSYTGIVCNYFTMTKDPDGDNVMHFLDWGDGTITKTGHIPSGSLENASHTWSRPGEYPVRVCSLDDKGAPSQWSGPFLVSISANDPPEQPTTPSGPAAGQCLISHEYATSARDPDGDAVKYIFDWGDGTTSWTGLEYLDSGEESSVSHKWMQPGAYQIKAAALDDIGLISNWSGALAVKIE